MYIPALGDEIELSKELTANVTFERRNDSFTDMFFPNKKMISNWTLSDTGRENIQLIIRTDDNTYQEYVSLNKKIESNIENWSSYFDRRDAILKFKSEIDILKSKTIIGNSLPFTFPVGTSMKIDRIYIKKGSSDFNSVTFWVKLPTVKKKYRLWLKLDDVNNIEFNKK